MTEESGARLSSSLVTEIQKHYGFTEEEAKDLASDPDFGPYIEWALNASRESAALLDELEVAVKELEDLLPVKSSG
ncbi:MAG: hypothetical protein HYW06_06445 [Gemmatimonadetes bacterium]|nr:hypothetical protein [Gemmatimonadota bacterium]MBI2401175.1 hypothetical protein [Gemmatimonadota bacterium]MBI2536594.1 hypothetical protein [Gemmatimonadota bacterium]